MVASGSHPGHAVDEFQAVGLQGAEGMCEVGHLPGHVMDSGAPSSQEAAHGGIGAQGLQEFDRSDEEDPDTLIGEFLGQGTVDPLEAFIEGPGSLDGWDGDPDVVEGAEKGGFHRDLSGGVIFQCLRPSGRSEGRQSLLPVPVQIKERSWPRARTS